MVHLNEFALHTLKRHLNNQIMAILHKEFQHYMFVQVY